MASNTPDINPTMTAEWTQLTPFAKREQRLNWWRESAGSINFVNAEAKKAYQTSVERQIAVYDVAEPDRVPVSFAMLEAMPMYAYGLDYNTGIHDYNKMRLAYDAFNKKHARELEAFLIPPVMFPARVYEILDFKQYAWPGHGLALSGEGYQFVEGEYMKANEYDSLIRDPSDFWLRTYLPRAFGALQPFRSFGPLTNIIEAVSAMSFLPLMNPQVQQTLKTLQGVGQELTQVMTLTMDFMQRGLAEGYSQMSYMFGKAPFDTLGDTLRGTQGIMKDMYRQPDKLLEAIDVVTDITINSLISQANASRGLLAMFPLHKGADGWMSQKQFGTFYWPSLRKILNALVNEGIMSVLFAEGSYNTRLDSVNEFPKGFVQWLFDQTDMARAKNILGDKCCIWGNVPSSLLITGTPSQVKEYSRKLIDVCGKGGGYILSPGSAGIDHAKIENLRAMVEAAREYGVYR